MSKSTPEGGKKPSTIRCAIYARFSSDHQNPTSSRDQVRNCEKVAKEKGWTILPDYIVSDEGISGESIAGRPGLLRLLEEAKKKIRPYDCLLIDSSCRFARDSGDGLTLRRTLHFHDIFLYFVADRLDSRKYSSRQPQSEHRRYLSGP